MEKWIPMWTESVNKGQSLPWKTGESLKDWKLHFKVILDYIGQPTNLKDVKIFVPLCGDTPFFSYAWSKGCTVVGIDIAPLALGLLRQQIGENEKDWECSDIPTGKKWRYKDNRAIVYQSDMFQECPEMVNAFDFIMDKDALNAIPVEMRPSYAKLITKYLKKGGIVLSTTSFRLQNLGDGPPFHTPKEDVAECFSELKYEKYLGELYKLPSSFHKKISHVLRKE